MKKQTPVTNAVTSPWLKFCLGTGLAFLLCGTAHAAVTYQAQIRSMNLFATGVNGPLGIHLDAAQASVGMLSVAPDGTPGDINPGNGQATVIASFFDIFAELSPVTACFPNCPDETPVQTHVTTSGSCETFSNFFDVFPPNCPYQGDTLFSIEDVIALIAEFLFNDALPTEFPPQPGWDFALVMATNLQIATNPARGYRFLGETIIDFRQVPEPATAPLVALAVFAAAAAGRLRMRVATAERRTSVAT
jgi:hypothetical protein